MKLMLADEVALTDQGATLFFQNSNDTIERHMLKAKVFRSDGFNLVQPSSYKEVKERPSEAVKIGSMYLPKIYQQYLYVALWLEYLKHKPELVKKLESYSECEHPVLNLFVKDRGKTLINNIQPLLRLLQGKEHVIYVQGNLLDSYASIICHQVNCQGVAGTELDLQLEQRYCNWFFAYRDWVYGLGNKLLGDCQWVPCEKHIVVNLYGQEFYGQEPNVCYTNIDALKAALLKTKTEAKHRNLPIAIPYGLGCEIGGAQWQDVLAMIEDVFKDYYVLIYKKDEE